MLREKRKMRIAAVGDLHCTQRSGGDFEPLLAEITRRSDVLLLCGDLTDYGLPEEAHVLVRELAAARLPVIGVLGNHDFESGKQDEVRDILREAGVVMLDGEAHEVNGVGFAGAKGFAGGFGRGRLSPWGEPAVKMFVQEAVNEARKLDEALSRLETARRIVVLHYAPIRGTVVGEPPELFAYLGSSKLEEPLARFPVTAVFHGHAHHGTFEGCTRDGVPVYNVSMPVLRRRFPNRLPFHVLEVEA
jgi:Icc-related predicted phosphoesterase